MTTESNTLNSITSLISSIITGNEFQEQLQTILGSELTLAQRATITEDFIRAHGICNSGVPMSVLIEALVDEADTEDIMYEITRNSERCFHQWMTATYDFDEIIGWFNETMMDYIAKEYSLSELAKHFDSFDLMDEAVRTIEPEALIHHMRERDTAPAWATIPDALENDMDLLIDKLSTHLANPENFEKYGEKLVKALVAKNEDFIPEFIGVVNDQVEDMHGTLAKFLAEIQPGIEDELTIEMYLNAQRQIQQMLDNGMWFSDACHILGILDDTYHLQGDAEQIDKFWDQLANDCVSPKGVEPKIEHPMF